MPASADSSAGGKRAKRTRARDLGIHIGVYPRGRFNAITDVPGVRVGHSTLISGDVAAEPGSGPVRTGVTAIFPHRGNIYTHRVIGSGHVLNGAGELAGLTQLMEWGLIETPILLTNTLAVGTCSEAVMRWMVERNPRLGTEQDVIIPLVGECDDSWLNDIRGRHIHHAHVFEALDTARGGSVTEGSVGGGTGMITCDFKAGIGTSSRKLPVGEGGYVVGALVMSNFGRREDLRVDGVPVGRALSPEFATGAFHDRESLYGSIIVVIATNAPLLAQQLTRVCKRAALGVGRVGSYAAHGSGEIILGFSTANLIPRQPKGMTFKIEALLDQRIDALYRATIEVTEEAIINALCAGRTMTGRAGHVVPGMPLERVRSLVRDSHRLPELQRR